MQLNYTPTYTFTMAFAKLIHFWTFRPIICTPKFPVIQNINTLDLFLCRESCSFSILISACIRLGSISSSDSESTMQFMTNDYRSHMEKHIQYVTPWNYIGSTAYYIPYPTVTRTMHITNKTLLLTCG